MPRWPSLSVEERFWLKVDKKEATECWLWKAYCNWVGYGQFKIGYKVMPAHRYSYELHIGSIPEGLHVLHKCDNPPCVNPAHLFLGTHGDNMRDMINKKRNPNLKGENNGRTKLTELQVKEIKYRYLNEKVTQRALAKEYKISGAQISGIVLGKIWKHLNEPSNDDNTDDGNKR